MIVTQVTHVPIYYTSLWWTITRIVIHILCLLSLLCWLWYLYYVCKVHRTSGDFRTTNKYYYHHHHYRRRRHRRRRLRHHRHHHYYYYYYYYYYYCYYYYYKLSSKMSTYLASFNTTAKNMSFPLILSSPVEHRLHVLTAICTSESDKFLGLSNLFIRKGSCMA